MAKENVSVSKSPNGIATVTLNRPEKHNAFDEVIIRQLNDAFREVDSNNSIKVMILEAKGKNFSAGADLAWMKRMADYSYEDNLKDAKALADMLHTLNFMSKPTIARVQGAAFGGAVGLVSCCDISIGTTDARFSLSEVKIGLMPATISPYVIAAIGERAARRYFLTAEVFLADEAQNLGLLSEVVDVENLDHSISALVEKLLANSPAAITAAKALVFNIANKPVSNTLIDYTSECIASIRVTAEAQEGLAAFLEKRQPSWLKSE